MAEELFGEKLPEIRLELRVLALPEEIRRDPKERNKLFAYSTGVETNEFENDYRAFEKIALALNDRDVDPERLSPPSVAEAAWAVEELGRKKPAFAFSPEVKEYIVTLMLQQGLLWPPPQFDDLKDLIEEKVEQNFPELKPVQEEVKRRWPGIAAQENPEFNGEDAVTIQMAKLWSIKRYVEERNEELDRELESVFVTGTS